MRKLNSQNQNDSPQLMGPKELLLRAWSPGSRPSRQWLARHTPGLIPGVKVGGRWFYNMSQVLDVLGLRGKGGNQ